MAKQFRKLLELLSRLGVMTKVMHHSLCKVERGLLADIVADFPKTTFALLELWSDESGQDVAEYSVMLAVVLVIVVGTVRLIGSNASNIFSQVGSTIQ